MAWNEKYFTEFKNDAGELFRLSLKEEDWSGSNTELKSGANPVSIVSSEGDYLEPVVGTGININLISNTPLQLLGLNTVNKFSIKVQFYKNSIIIWDGWLNTEEYSEIYSEYENYIVSFTSTDGIALLDNIPFLTATGDNYKGIRSVGYVISEILKKTQVTDGVLHIVENIILYDKDYNSLGPASSGNTILDGIKVNLDNYIDETGDTMSCKAVLKEILRPLGLMFRNNVFTLSSGSNARSGFTIFDNNLLFKTTDATVNTFNFNEIWQSSWTIQPSDLTYDLQNDLHYTDTGANLTLTESISKQKLTYSSYLIDNVLDLPINVNSLDGYNVIDKVEKSTVACDNGGNKERWSEWVYDGMKNYTMLEQLANPSEEVYGVDGTTTYLERGKDYFISTPSTDTGNGQDLWFETTVDTPYVFKDIEQGESDFYNIAILVNFSMMVRNKSCYNSTPIDINGFGLEVKVSIGGKVNYAVAYFGKDNELISTDEYLQPELDKQDINSDKKGVLVRFKYLTGGDTTVFPGKVKVGITQSMSLPNAPSGSSFRFKDFTAKVVEDVSKGDFNSLYSDYTVADNFIDAKVNTHDSSEGADINLLHGSNISRGIERGSFLYPNANKSSSYYHLKLMSKTDEVIILTTESWLLNKVFANRYNPMIKLSNIAVKASDLENSILIKVTDIAQFPSKKLMVVGYEYKPYNNEVIFSLLEVNIDAQL